MFDDLKPTRKTFSSYYIASIFAFFLFQLIPNAIIKWSNWIASSLTTIFKVDLQDNNKLWLVFFVTTFFITFLIRRFLVQPLGFFISDEGAPYWELFILFFIVLGFNIYLLNQVFSQPMPTGWMPQGLIYFLDGGKNTYTSSSDVAVKNTWSFVPWFWHIFPLAFMFVRTKLIIKGEGE
jgi:hypothetical protein